jgi:O-antigen/teichoic acid export membrane protein
MKRLRELRDLFGRLGADRALLYLALARLFQGLSGPVTLILIARHFSGVVQGFHYTFMSLIALQTFVELGTYVVIINVASHEWSKLRVERDGSIAGDPVALDRLISLGRLMFRWYAVAAAIFVVGVGAVGHSFLASQADAATVSWRAQWWTLVILTAAQLLSMAFNSLLEGCNQVQQINKLRLVQVVVSAAALWIVIGLGGGLWAAVAGAAVSLGRDAYLLLVRYRTFFKPFFVIPASGMDWSKEIWPLQWRIGAQGLVNYFMYSLFTPVVFHYHGAVEAGRMGMTWQIAVAVQTLALSPVLVLVPRFGMLAAQRNWRELDSVWKRASALAVALSLLGAAMWLAIAFALQSWGGSFATRVLPPLPTACLLAASVLMVVITCEAVYLRAHKQEPLVLIGVGSSIAAGLLIWWLGARYASAGAAGAFLAVTLLVNTPLVSIVWLRKRREWHTDPTLDATEVTPGGNYVHV